jgi:hypothetical protein
MKQSDIRHWVDFRVAIVAVVVAAAVAVLRRCSYLVVTEYAFGQGSRLRVRCPSPNWTSCEAIFRRLHAILAIRLIYDDTGTHQEQTLDLNERPDDSAECTSWPGAVLSLAEA